VGPASKCRGPLFGRDPKESSCALRNFVLGGTGKAEGRSAAGRRRDPERVPKSSGVVAFCCSVGAQCDQTKGHQDSRMRHFHSVARLALSFSDRSPRLLDHRCTSKSRCRSIRDRADLNASTTPVHASIRARTGRSKQPRIRPRQLCHHGSMGSRFCCDGCHRGALLSTSRIQPRGVVIVTVLALLPPIKSSWYREHQK
jgi:hypothetical protein